MIEFYFLPSLGTYPHFTGDHMDEIIEDQQEQEQVTNDNDPTPEQPVTGEGGGETPAPAEVPPSE